ncbi:MAG: hypothetical protein ABI047_10585 [Jatrophihabitantaceae bacterium]
MADPAYAAYVMSIVDQAPPATDEDTRALRELIQAGRPQSRYPSSQSDRLTA